MRARFGFGGREGGFDGGRNCEFSSLGDAVNGASHGLFNFSLGAGAGCERFQGFLEFFWFRLLRGFGSEDATA